jgi:hypothetical protein
MTHAPHSVAAGLFRLALALVSPIATASPLATAARVEAPLQIAPSPASPTGYGFIDPSNSRDEIPN